MAVELPYLPEGTILYILLQSDEGKADRHMLIGEDTPMTNEDVYQWVEDQRASYEKSVNSDAVITAYQIFRP